MTFRIPQCPPGGTEIRIGETGNIADFGWSDASIKRGAVGVGLLLYRIGNGYLTERSLKLDMRTKDSTLAEFVALENLLGTASEFQVVRLHAFVDSFQLIEHAAKAMQGRPSRYDDVMTRISERVQNFDGIIIQNVNNRSMKRADALARQAIC